MIDIAELRKEHIGAWVLYDPGCGRKEKGRIKSWNEHFIFVVYKCANEWGRYQEYTGCATKEADLRFTTKDEVV